LTAGGQAVCWGSGEQGALGDGRATTSHIPVAVLGSQFVQLTAGSAHTCGLTANGTAVCWGRNVEMQLGDGTNTQRNSPQAVSGDLRFLDISANHRGTVGLTAGGQAVHWGWPPGLSSSPASTPQPTPGSHEFVEISRGESHACATKSDNTTYCWGNNAYFQLGDIYAPGYRAEPQPTSPMITGSGISAGGSHTCLVGPNADGMSRALCWGRNNRRQLGDGRTVSQSALAGQVRAGPNEVINLRSVSAGYEHSCGMSPGGVVYCWGRNHLGQLGDGTIGGEGPYATKVAGWEELE
jgi:alpha-tubulin suppressor-like RCC1 family protein